MPSWFMLMPSETEIVVNSRGVPPASATPSLAASTWKAWVMLHGVCSPFIETTPIIGFWIAASSSPIARMKARCGVRASPSRVMSDRSFLIASERLLYPSFHQAIIRDNGTCGELRICPFAAEAHRRPAALTRRFLRHYCGNFPVLLGAWRATVIFAPRD